MGLLHVLLALAALLFGRLVLLHHIGDAGHCRSGRAYRVSMLGLNLTTLLNYELFGYFGLFPWQIKNPANAANTLSLRRGIVENHPGFHPSGAFR